MMIKKIGIFFIVFALTSSVFADKPVFSGGDSIQIDIDENSQAVTTVSATDPDGTRIKYTLVNSYGDSRLFKINLSSGVLTFKTAKNYENPEDSNEDNIYTARVKAKDNNKEQSFQIISVYIQDVNDNNPVISNEFSKQNVDENHLFVKEMTGSAWPTTPNNRAKI